MVDRTLRRIFILSGIALILWVLYLLKPVVLPFVAAFLVAYLFSPLVDKIHKIGLPRWLAISIVFYWHWCGSDFGHVVSGTIGLGTADVCARQYSSRNSLVKLHLLALGLANFQCRADGNRYAANVDCGHGIYSD